MSDLKNSFDKIKVKSVDKKAEIEENNEVNAFRVKKKVKKSRKKESEELPAEIFLYPFEIFANIIIFIFSIIYKLRFVIAILAIIIAALYFLGFDFKGFFNGIIYAV